MYEIISKSVLETEQLGEKIGKKLWAGCLVSLNGDLGTGKTAFTRGITKSQGIDTDNVSSPTFNLMNSYSGTTNVTHFDLYRLKNEEELEDIGFYDSINNDDKITIIEWSDKFTHSLPQDKLNVLIEYIDENQRVIFIAPHGEKYLQLCKELFK